MTQMRSGCVLRNGIVVKNRYSIAAIQDLEEIGDYIADTLKSLIAALNTVGKIQDTVDKLTSFPLIGSPLSSIEKTDTDHRFLVSGSYLVFYHAETDNIYIDRILYGRRNYIKTLFGNASMDDSKQVE